MSLERAMKWVFDYDNEPVGSVIVGIYGKSTQLSYILIEWSCTVKAAFFFCKHHDDLAAFASITVLAFKLLPKFTVCEM